MRKRIKYFPNYTIDTDGIVRNKNDQIIKPEVTKNGYERVSLCNKRIKHKRMTVHRLVAKAFIPNPDGLSQVNHINENKRDNNVENLELVTPLQNLEHSNIIDKASKAKFTKIECVNTGKIYNSIKEVEDIYGLAHSNLVACCNGRRHTCGGLKWKYVEKED